jgi:septal ring factor EnvC (AmiA/AmiB activator)
VEDHVAQPTAPDGSIVTLRPRRRRRPRAPKTPAASIVVARTRRRLKIAVSLFVVVAGLLLLLYGQEVVEVVENVYSPATRAGDDLAQVKQALQQERDKTEKLVGDLTTDLAQVKQALQQERDKTQKLADELTTTLAQIKQALT